MPPAVVGTWRLPLTLRTKKSRSTGAYTVVARLTIASAAASHGTVLPREAVATHTLLLAVRCRTTPPVWKRTIVKAQRWGFACFPEHLYVHDTDLEIVVGSHPYVLSTNRNVKRLDVVNLR